MRITSSDNVSVAVHELGGSSRPLLISHATGFHGRCYQPVADQLKDGFTSFAMDYRGHGETQPPSDWVIDWAHYGDDAAAVAQALAPDGGLVGFGHSMGATALLMAAHRNPGLFDVIVAFEPIIVPPPVMIPPGGLPIAEAARRRRPTFDSFAAAIDNYRSKPPMSEFDPEVLRLYVKHGFEASPDGVTLRCLPATEAGTFDAGHAHHAWDILGEIETRVVVVVGKVDGIPPATFARPVADRLANASYVEIPTTNHFGPFIDPTASAQLIADATAQSRSGVRSDSE